MTNLEIRINFLSFFHSYKKIKNFSSMKGEGERKGVVVFFTIGQENYR